MSFNLQNAYLNPKTREKNWFVSGNKCGKDQGKVIINVHMLYGLKSAGTLWRSAVTELLSNLASTATHANPDVWICP
eukprot:1323857-Ditylum_brightwellii.AAC.2